MLLFSEIWHKSCVVKEHGRSTDDTGDEATRRQRDDIARLRSELARRERDGKGLQRQNDRLKRENDGLQRENDGLQREKDRLKREKDRFQRERDRLRREIERLKQQLAAARRAGRRQAAPFAKDRRQGRGGRTRPATRRSLWPAGPPPPPGAGVTRQGKLTPWRH